MKRDRSGAAFIVYDLIVESAKNILMGFETVKRARLRRPRAFVDHDSAVTFLQASAFDSLGLLDKYVGGVKGRSVCEIGPGDFLTTGLAMLAAGATRYCVIDRFPGEHSGDRAKHWYRQLRDHWPRFRPEISWDESIEPDYFPERYGDKVEVVSKPLESVETSGTFDIVCSFQVGEHVTDIDHFAEIHNRLLATGGVGLHRVDFGPHDVWFRYRDPGVFLRFPDPVWRLTGSNRGVPNRKRHYEFLEAFERAGLKVDVVLTEEFDRSAIDLTKLNRRFRKMPQESLLVSTAIYRLSRRD